MQRCVVKGSIEGAQEGCDSRSRPEPVVWLDGAFGDGLVEIGAKRWSVGKSGL